MKHRLKKGTELEMLFTTFDQIVNTIGANSLEIIT